MSQEPSGKVIELWWVPESCMWDMDERNAAVAGSFPMHLRGPIPFGNDALADFVEDAQEAGYVVVLHPPTSQTEAGRETP